MCKCRNRCRSGSTTPVQFACGNANVYCPKGSAALRAVTPGFYSIGGFDATTRDAQTPCESGFYCDGGVRKTCPGGTWSPPNQTQCEPCAAGRYGLGGSTSVQCDGPCDPGYWFGFVFSRISPVSVCLLVCISCENS
jgi:hypothetical protein